VYDKVLTATLNQGWFVNIFQVKPYPKPENDIKLGNINAILMLNLKLRCFLVWEKLIFLHISKWYRLLLACIEYIYLLFSLIAEQQPVFLDLQSYVRIYQYLKSKFQSIIMSYFQLLDYDYLVYTRWLCEHSSITHIKREEMCCS
jgi:hypothetical protein